MSDTIIRVENLGKKYIIGHQQEGRSNYVALRDVIANTAKSLVKRFTQPSQENPNKEEFWALKDVSFEIKQGECVGIIGRNGAGKSTLLKILSRITEPTTGLISIKGRVASLLEVGTGFHPELTGRENIYLNGAILGMSRVEIKKKFDEIVAFAEVEKFLDTPVKRYSSGMYVRLAFAVAAHLEPEILVVDEVLAVGDAAFQKKCLGKMGDVATKEGRTVLFVSHNMAVIQKLCSQAIYISQGKIVKQGKVNRIVKSYLSSMESFNDELSLYDIPRSKGLGTNIRISGCQLLDSKSKQTNNLLFGEPFTLDIEAIAHLDIDNISILVRIDSFTKDPIVTTASESSNEYFSVSSSEPLKILASFKNLLLSPGSYWITISIRQGKQGLDQIPQVIKFEVYQATYKETNPHPGSWGYIQFIPDWNRHEISI